jgi:ADP-ribosylglycohydrolase
VTIPSDYTERVYAGVLGKIIGVYAGKPFEGWTHERIVEELGTIRYYVHERLGVPLVALDDDISGTLTFLRAMPDYGMSPELSSAQIGQTWLNYLIEGKTVLWWGGMGQSTEHTAYLRLKSGVPAPDSGSMALNGQVVAEQIGAQIFIDGWGMIAPAQPRLAADLAQRAARVSHDGEAVYAAQLIAAMEAQAFVESDVQALIDTGLSVIPKDSLMARLIADVRTWYARHDDWHDTFAHIRQRYGYHHYGGNCHVVPNHAVIIMALLYSGGDFSRAMTIVNTAGWDTDCNSGNVGCLMGIRGGLAGLETGPDWRGPVADRLYLPTADGGRAVTDALSEAIEIARIGLSLAGLELAQPKSGARYHFQAPGAVQGWLVDRAPDSLPTCTLSNAPGHSADGTRSLAIAFETLTEVLPARILRETYPADHPTEGYQMVACPNLYQGQTVTARLEADSTNSCPVTARLVAITPGPDDASRRSYGPAQVIAPGGDTQLAWRVKVPEGEPVLRIGLELASESRCDGTVYLDWLTWKGEPDVALGPPSHHGRAWTRVWAQACDAVQHGAGSHYRVIQNRGTGMLIQGTRDWHDLTIEATVVPHLAASFGIAARVQGLERYYALIVSDDGRLAIIRRLDGTQVLAARAMAWDLDASYHLSLTVVGERIVGHVNGVESISASDGALRSGAIALVCKEGRIDVSDVHVRGV